MGNAAPRTAVTNVRVFDGRHLRPPGTVVIEGDRIGAAQKSSGAALAVDDLGGTRSSSWPPSA